MNPPPFYKDLIKALEEGRIMKSCDNCKYRDYDHFLGWYCMKDMEPDSETDHCRKWKYNA